LCPALGHECLYEADGTDGWSQLGPGLRCASLATKNAKLGRVGSSGQGIDVWLLDYRGSEFRDDDGYLGNARKCQCRYRVCTTYGPALFGLSKRRRANAGLPSTIPLLFSKTSNREGPESFDSPLTHQ
jgi:hypothetical protein